MSIWQDLTTDYKTGHTVAKDFYKALSFAAGLIYLFGLIPVVLVLSLVLQAKDAAPVLLPVEVGVVLLGNGIGLQVIKEMGGYFNRKTADSAGQPLAEPGSMPPVPMPQVENPNAPATPPPTE